MTIYVNDKAYDAPDGCSLITFLEMIGYKPQGIAIAIGDRVIPKTAWETTLLTDNMELMLIHAVSGG